MRRWLSRIGLVVGLLAVASAVAAPPESPTAALRRFLKEATAPGAPRTPVRDQITRVARTLPAERRAARRAGIPLSLRELTLPPVSPANNAAPLYLELSALLKAKPLTEADSSLLLRSIREPMTDAEWLRLSGLLRNREPALKLIREAASRRGCRFPRDWALGVQLEFPEYPRLRDAVRLLTAQSAALAHGKQFQAAIRRLELAFNVSKHSGSDRVLISYLVEVACYAITTRGVESLLHQPGLDFKMLKEVEALLARHPPPTNLDAVLRRELGMLISPLRSIRAEGLGPLDALLQEKKVRSPKLAPAEQRLVQELADAWEADALHWGQEANRIFELPVWEQAPRFEALSRFPSPGDNPLFTWRILVQPHSKVGEARSASIARQRLLLGAGALLLYHRAQGEFPAALPSSVPRDPFNGKPFGYRREGRGFILYSVGASGRFAGGTAASRTEDRKKEFFFVYP